MCSRVWGILRFFLFCLDAELAHRIVIHLIQFGIRLRGEPLRWMSHTPNPKRVNGQDDHESQVFRIENLDGASRPERVNGHDDHESQVFGLSFASPIGLAAGFDKNCEILSGLPDLGFGFAEIGTVTPKPQPGNPRPRLFRDLKSDSFFNCMGFNNIGAPKVADRVARAKKKLPPFFRVGINLGKNKDTPLEEAVLDYQLAAMPFEGLADYLVINVSSPNTPGLRSLQTLEGLRPLIDGVLSAICKWSNKPPLLLKLAPEVQGENLHQLLEGAERWGIDGWILVNTLGGSWNLSSTTALTGGWSGKILTDVARSCLKEARQWTTKPIISVGGILDLNDATQRFHDGASLIQIYSGWILNGPQFPTSILSRITSKNPAKSR